MKKSLILILLFVCMSFSIAKDVSVEEVNKKVLDVENILTEEVDEGVTRYVYGSGLVASVKDSEINYYHSDRIQSNRLITTSFGEIENEFLSLPFGQLIVNSGIRYAFATGKELDESDLYYFGVRYYDSDLGRFTSVDPVKENEPYSYVRNNPLYFVDSDGKEPVTVKFAEPTNEWYVVFPTTKFIDILGSIAGNIEVSEEYCAGSVSLFYQELYSEFYSNPIEKLFNKAYTVDFGVYGTAWNMRNNIIANGGSSVLYSEMSESKKKG